MSFHGVLTAGDPFRGNDYFAAHPESTVNDLCCRWMMEIQIWRNIQVMVSDIDYISIKAEKAFAGTRCSWQKRIYLKCHEVTKRTQVEMCSVPVIHTYITFSIKKQSSMQTVLLNTVLNNLERSIENPPQAKPSFAVY